MEIDLRARRTFSHIGLLMVLVLAVMYGVSLLLELALMRFEDPDPSLVTLLSSLPLYAIAFPLVWLTAQRMERAKLPECGMRPGQWFQTLLVCLPIMYAGSILGNVVSYFVSQGGASNPVEEILQNGGLLETALAVLVAPVVEEILSRKLVIDRTIKYGEKTAIVFSAMLFGLLHRNFFQFFYAFGLGLVLGYVYVRTGRLRYGIALHMTVNFMGGVIGPLLLRLIDYDRLMAITETMDEQAMMLYYTEHMPQMLLVFGYIALIGIATLAGVALLILHRGRLYFRPTIAELPRGVRFRTVYVNVGVGLFMLICIVLMGLSLF